MLTSTCQSLIDQFWSNRAPARASCQFMERPTKIPKPSLSMDVSTNLKSMGTFESLNLPLSTDLLFPNPDPIPSDNLSCHIGAGPLVDSNVGTMTLSDKLGTNNCIESIDFPSEAPEADLSFTEPNLSLDDPWLLLPIGQSTVPSNNTTVESSVKKGFPSDTTTKQLKCQSCPAVFTSHKQLSAHVRTHKDHHICKTCGVSFPSAQRLKAHRDKHSTELKYQCKHCSKKFKFSKSLRLHTSRHFSFPQFKCNICGKAFYQKGNLLQHQAVHSELRKFVCKECGKSYKLKSCLTKHQLIHANEVFNCPVCGRSFTSAKSLEIHKNHHLVNGITPNDIKETKKGKVLRYKSGLSKGDKTSGNYTCEFCNKQFTQYANMNAHVHKKHLPKPVSCPICRKQFAYNYEMKEHSLTHMRDGEGELMGSEFECKECGKFFSRLQNLKRHKVVVHFGIKAFVCRLCKNNFASRGNLKHHLISVHELEAEAAVAMCKQQKGANLKEVEAQMKSFEVCNTEKQVPAAQLDLSRETPMKLKRSSFLEALQKARKDCRQIQQQ